MLKFIIPIMAGLMASLVLSATAGTAADRHERPDETRAPGAINPDVTISTIDETICLSGWTKTIRPPVSKTNTLKRTALATWGYTDRIMSHYEEDHRVPLEIGGAPDDPANLWPEPYNITWGARTKDKLETFAKREVCAHRMTLDQGQAIFTGDWIAAFKEHCGSTPTARCNH